MVTASVRRSISEEKKKSREAGKRNTKQAKICHDSFYLPSEPY